MKNKNQWKPWIELEWDYDTGVRELQTRSMPKNSGRQMKKTGT